jgi:hypothetical protein
MAYKVRLKIVPNADPNADGVWVEVECDDKLIERIKAARSFFSVTELFVSHISPDCHIVRVDLKCILELRSGSKTLRFEDH